MRTELKQVNGITEIFAGGQMLPRTSARADLPAYLAIEKMRQYEEAHIDVILTNRAEPDLLGWDGADDFDYTYYDHHIRKLIKFNKNAKLILYIGGRTGAPYLWCKNNEGELTRFSNGQRINAPSLASKVWLRDSTHAIARLVRHYAASEFASNIIGYNPILSGNEWFGFGGYHKTPEEGFADYSDPMVFHFREFLRDRYGNNVDALRDAWRDKIVSFDNAQVPSPEARLSFGHTGMFHYREHHGVRCADFWYCLNECNADMAIAYCRAVKEASPEPILCGLMHGYAYLLPHGGPFPQHHGHVLAKKLYESPYVDFFQSPYSYYNRCFAGTHYSQHPVDSILLHGKVMLDQLDTKTHLKDDPNTNAKTPFETDNVLKRDIAYSLTKNCHHYWMEIWAGVFSGYTSASHYCPLHFDDPSVKKLIGQLRKVSDEGQMNVGQGVSEIALFISKESPLHRRMEDGFGKIYNEGMRQFVLPFVGAPFDDYILEDFERVRRPYKLYIFNECGYVPRARREAIRRKLEAEGATALWFYAPGYVDETGCAIEHIEALTGIKMGRDDVFDYLHIDLVGDHSLLEGVKRDYGCLMDMAFFHSRQEWLQWPRDQKVFRFGPFFHADDPAAVTLGTLRRTGKPGLVVKDVNGSRSVFSAAPMPPAELVTNVAASAGVHLYSPGDLIYANSRYLCVGANSDGTRTIRLPSKQRVVDVFSNQTIANAAELSLTLVRGETRIFRLS